MQSSISPRLQLGGLAVEIPQLPLGAVDGIISSASFSSPGKVPFKHFLLCFILIYVHLTAATNESCIPASLTASKFDPNSSRHLSDFLETVGLSHYSGKKMKWFIFISKSIEWVHFFLSCSRSLSAK
jgi:hypothetical protein